MRSEQHRRYPGGDRARVEELNRLMDCSFASLDEMDAGRLFGLFADVFSSGYMSADLLDAYRNAEHLREEMLGAARRPGAIALAVEVEGRPAGYVTVIPRTATRLRHTADLNMGVASDCRGQGIGRMLLEEALRRASEGGVLEIIYLMVRADNLPAVRLYEKAGFEKLAVLERDIKSEGEYFTGILMRRFV